MKPGNKILVLIVIFFFFACGPRPIPPPEPVKFHPGNKLFARAERMLQRKAHDKALEIYNEYLSRFPNGHLAAEAVMKTGLIHSALGKNIEARQIYKHLIAKYPASPPALDARVEILVTFFNQGKFSQVISQAARVLEGPVYRGHILKTYTLLGDSYSAIGSPLEAVKYYLMAYKKADAQEKEGIIFKIESAAMEVDPAAIIPLFIRLQDELLARELIYGLGLKKFEGKKYDDAIDLLSEFVKRFPGNKNIQQAKKLIQDINVKFTFQHNTLGCLLPLSGPYQTYGTRILHCIELALSQFSSKNNRPLIKLIVKDTESDPGRAVLAVNELSEERVGAIIGPVATHEAAALEAQKKSIPIVTFSQKENITEIGKYVFRNFITPKMQVETIVSYAIEVLGLGRFAILYPDDKYGSIFMDLFYDEVMAYGGEVVVVEPYNPNQTDFAEPIKNLIQSQIETSEHSDNKMVESASKQPEPVIDFDAVFIPDGPTTSGLIIPQLAFYDVVGVQLLGTNLWHSDRLIEMAQQFVQGAIMVDGFFAESNSQKVKDFVEMFEETFDEKPGFIEAVAYDTAIMLFNLVSRPDIQSRSELKNEIWNLQDFHGLTGMTSFDNTGSADKELYLLQIKGDKFIELE
jgi:ABC-type branched-subunit amino acid transport system substrate-binding protein/TolA-binding protein